MRLLGFETRVLRRVIDHKRREGRGSWRKLHIGELNTLYTPQTIKPRRMKWVWHVAHLEEIGMST
jgi:hypothetical protein